MNGDSGRSRRAIRAYLVKNRCSDRSSPSPETGRVGSLPATDLAGSLRIAARGLRRRGHRFGLAGRRPVLG